jgi:hypothetical protein
MRIRRLWPAAIVAIVAFASCGGASSSAAGGASATGSTGTWTTVVTFNGTGEHSQDTAPFQLPDGKARFLFTVQPNSTGPVPFLAQMFTEGTPVSPNELHRTSCASCSGEQTDDLGNVRAGSYYLHVITSRPWTLTVQASK